MQFLTLLFDTMYNNLYSVYIVSEERYSAKRIVIQKYKL